MSLKLGIDSTSNALYSTAGIVLAGKIFEKYGLSSLQSSLIPKNMQQALAILCGLYVQGRTSYAEAEQVRHDQLFHRALNLPSGYAPETIRLYLERLAAGFSDAARKFLDQVNQNLLADAQLTPVHCRFGSYIPVDIDVSPLDNSKSKKEGVGRTYKGHDGYAPIFSYIGAEGYMLDCELRPGKQHCQNQTPEYLERTLKKLSDLPLEHPVLLRLDSGNDAYATLKVLMKSPHFFLVKRNLRRESPLRWLEIACAMGSCSTPREGKRVYSGVLTALHPQAPQDEELPQLDQVYRVTVRTIDRHGVPYLIPDVEAEVYWTNLYEDPDTIIDLYHDHGSSEQFHSELKSDMNVERLSSGKLAVNSLLLHIARIAFNTLRLIGQSALHYREKLPYRHKGKRKRLRKVIDDLIRISCKAVRHAGKWIIKIWSQDPWYDAFLSIYLRL